MLNALPSATHNITVRGENWLDNIDSVGMWFVTVVDLIGPTTQFVSTRNGTAFASSTLAVRLQYRSQQLTYNQLLLHAFT